MIKPASLEDELFVVLIPGGLVAEKAAQLQRAISEEYELYDREKLPPLHITIDRIKKEKKLEAARIIIESLQNFSAEINILLEDFLCLKQHENRFLVLNVKGTDSLIDFSNRVHARLDRADITTIENYEEWNFHITLVNNHFVDKPLTWEDFTGLCQDLEDEVNKIISSVNRLEIWRATSEETRRAFFSLDLKGWTGGKN